jgi:hypothetical protein
MVGSKHAIWLVFGLSLLVLVDETGDHSASIEDPQGQQQLVVMTGADKSTELVQPQATRKVTGIRVVLQSLGGIDGTVGARAQSSLFKASHVWQFT